MKRDVRPGTRVSWDSSRGSVTGRAVKKQTRPAKIGKHKIAASRKNSQCIVQSEKTGAKAAHKPTKLRRAE